MIWKTWMPYGPPSQPLSFARGFPSSPSCPQPAPQPGHLCKRSQTSSSKRPLHTTAVLQYQEEPIVPIQEEQPREACLIGEEGL